MLPQADATIYLASQRGCSLGEYYRSYHTFNFRDYFHESRQPIGNLLAVNEDTITAGKTIVHRMNTDTAMLILPVLGALHYNCSPTIEGTLDVGQSKMLFLAKDSEIEISNPYKTESINFIHLCFNAASHPGLPLEAGTVDFDLTSGSNTLIPLNSAEVNNGQISQVFIGMFKGRHEGTYSLKNTSRGVFAYVLTGAFEIQNRLIQPHDGLGIWNIEELEFEALSNRAIIVIAELL